MALKKELQKNNGWRRSDSPTEPVRVPEPSRKYQTHILPGLISPRCGATARFKSNASVSKAFSVFLLHGLSVMLCYKRWALIVGTAPNQRRKGEEVKTRWNGVIAEKAETWSRSSECWAVILRRNLFTLFNNVYLITIWKHLVFSLLYSKISFYFNGSLWTNNYNCCLFLCN